MEDWIREKIFEVALGIFVGALNNGSIIWMILTGADDANTVPSTTNADLVAATTIGQTTNEISRHCNTSAQIRYRSDTSGANYFRLHTLGWTDNGI